MKDLVMGKNPYKNFYQLQSDKGEGIHYRICVTRRESSVAIIAPHGGGIEMGTSRIASAIAGKSYNLYCFEGLQSSSNNQLHITSSNFDEPQCLDLISKCETVVSVHGLRGEHQAIEVGGLDKLLGNRMQTNLQMNGFQISTPSFGKEGVEPNNICNRGLRQKGVQLEITKALRDNLVADELQLMTFVKAISQALISDYHA